MIFFINASPADIKAIKHRITFNVNNNFLKNFQIIYPLEADKFIASRAGHGVVVDFSVKL
jgi:hypothetical protein